MKKLSKALIVALTLSVLGGGLVVIGDEYGPAVTTTSITTAA